MSANTRPTSKRSTRRTAPGPSAGETADGHDSTNGHGDGHRAHR
jgi:hypothetical protein